MIVALIAPAYTGKSSIARVLSEKYGYVIGGFSDHLKGLTAYAVNTVAPHRAMSVDEIKRDKDKLRRLVQEFGSAIHFEDDPNWIKSFIDVLPDEVTGTQWSVPTQPCVIDCLRSAAQVEGARERGALVVGIDTTHATRCHLAAKTIGVTDPLLGRKLVKAADEHPIDGALDLFALPLDLRVINDHRYPVEDVADEIAEWAKERFAIELASKRQAIAELEESYGEDL